MKVKWKILCLIWEEKEREHNFELKKKLLINKYFYKKK